MSRYLGLDHRNVAACLRFRAQEMADQDTPTPPQAVLVELHRTGVPQVVVLGTDCAHPRETIQYLTAAQQQIAAAIARLNAQQAN